MAIWSVLDREAQQNFPSFPTSFQIPACAAPPHLFLWAEDGFYSQRGSNCALCRRTRRSKRRKMRRIRKRWWCWSSIRSRRRKELFHPSSPGPRSFARSLTPKGQDAPWSPRRCASAPILWPPSAVKQRRRRRVESRERRSGSRSCVQVDGSRAEVEATAPAQPEQPGRDIRRVLVNPFTPLAPHPPLRNSRHLADTFYVLSYGRDPQHAQLWAVKTRR